MDHHKWSCQKSRYHHHNVYNTWQYPTANQPFQHQTLELSSYLAPLWDRGLIHPSCNEALQLLQLKTPACILTNNKARVWAFEKLCRGEFPSNARVATFLFTISRCQASVHHVAGATILPSDFASGNARKCDNSTCQVCSFIQHTKDSVVLCASVQSILVGKAKLHFTKKLTLHFTKKLTLGLRSQPRPRAHLCPLLKAHSRLCSKENWREPSALKHYNLGCPAYDLHEKFEIF